MKLEDQVLSIEQILELQELGFDVLKNSSAIVIIKENDTFIASKEMVEKNIFGITDKIEDMFYTMTIGDIIEVLPTEIDKYVLNINRRDVSYDSRTNRLFYAYRRRFIDSLFDCLVWCIKNKHIVL